jgi:hypothetical protein
MVSNLTKLSLGSLLICIVTACISNTSKETGKLVKPLTDTCGDLRQYTGSFILSDVGCSGCHSTNDKRPFPDVPTFSEVAATDSLKLSDYIFKTKHNNLYIKEPMLRDHGNKKLDSLSDCQKKSLIHYIKDSNRKTPKI